MCFIAITEQSCRSVQVLRLDNGVGMCIRMCVGNGQCTSISHHRYLRRLRTKVLEHKTYSTSKRITIVR